MGDGELIVDGRHACPGVEDMSDAVAAEGGEVFGLKKRVVANFDGVLPPFGEFFEEAVEVGDEFASGGKVTGVELGEFEDKDADGGPKIFAWVEERVGEKFVVQKVRIGLTCGLSVAWLIGEVFEGEDVRDLKREAEVWRCGSAEFFEGGFGGELVIAGVDADGREGFGVFG